MKETKTESLESRIEESRIEESRIERFNLESRIERFNKELIGLLGKYKLGLGATAFIENGKVLARPFVVDEPKKVEETKSEVLES